MAKSDRLFIRVPVLDWHSDIWERLPSKTRVAARVAWVNATWAQYRCPGATHTPRDLHTSRAVLQALVSIGFGEWLDRRFRPLDPPHAPVMPPSYPSHTPSMTGSDLNDSQDLQIQERKEKKRERDARASEGEPEAKPEPEKPKLKHPLARSPDPWIVVAREYEKRYSETHGLEWLWPAHETRLKTIATWVTAQASRQRRTFAETLEILLDGFFANPKTQSEQHPITWLAHAPERYFDAKRITAAERDRQWEEQKNNAKLERERKQEEERKHAENPDFIEMERRAAALLAKLAAM